MKDTIMAVVRQVLTALGTLFATKGYVDGAEVETIVGALVALGSAFWATIEKKKDAKAKAELAQIKGE